jgi:uncharacterized protein YecA (UPF0149 family)
MKIGTVGYRFGMPMPPCFEDEYPEEAEILAEICEERAKRKAKGKKSTPLFLDALPEPQAVKAETVGRNDKCPCGSGKKYKKCCMNK